MLLSVRFGTDSAMTPNRHEPQETTILEQDHMAIKRRVRASQRFRSFWGAWRTIARLRSDSYDPQRPSVLQCRSTAPLHSRSVRGDELKCRSSTPTFGSITKLQHIPLARHWRHWQIKWSRRLRQRSQNEALSAWPQPWRIRREPIPTGFGALVKALPQSAGFYLLLLTHTC